jgi:MFS superfamily sulfate permease-like transporter
MTTEVKPQRTGFVPNVISGLATGLFSIPEGMAYAQLAASIPCMACIQALLRLSSHRSALAQS